MQLFTTNGVDFIQHDLGTNDEGEIRTFPLSDGESLYGFTSQDTLKPDGSYEIASIGIIVKDDACLSD